MLRSKILLSALLISPLLLTGCESNPTCNSGKYNCTVLDKKVEVSQTIQTKQPSKIQLSHPQIKENQIKESLQKPIKQKVKTDEQQAYDAMTSKIEGHYKPLLAKKTHHLYDYAGFSNMRITSQSGDAFDFTFTIKLIQVGNPKNTSECELEGWYDTDSKEVGFDDIPESCI